jgi:hypothetical protein
MNALVFYLNKNTPGKQDATGAFIPEAHAFAKMHAIPDTRLIGVNCIALNKAQRRKVVFDEIRRQRDLDCLAFFCHGWSAGIQLGISFREIQDLAYELSRMRSNQTRAATENLIVALYACSTADGPDDSDSGFGPAPGTDGGFADMLRDNLCQLELINCRVMGHKTAGHCSRNPYVVFFDGDGTPEGKTENSYEGGEWVVVPGSVLWDKWRKALSGDLRFRMPFMTREEIQEELAK